MEFLEETCDGKHNVPEVMEIIKQFEPFDIKLSTLVRMLDAIFEQGNTHAAQICQLRTDNRKQATMIAAQGEQLAVQGEQLTNVLEQNKENKEKLSVQGSKIDQLLSMMRPDEGAAGEWAPKSPVKKKPRAQEHAQKAVPRDSSKDSTKRAADRQALRVAARDTLLQHFVFGTDVTSTDSVGADVVTTTCTQANPAISITALGKALKELGVEKRRQANGTVYFGIAAK